MNVARKLERIDLFIERLLRFKPNDVDGIWGLCLAEIKHLKTGAWLPAGATSLDQVRYGYARTTVRSILTDYRSAARIRAPRQAALALRYLRPSIADASAYREDYFEQLMRDHTNLRLIDADKLIDSAIGVLQAAETVHPFTIAPALALVTGRRSYELACTASFGPGTGRVPYLSLAYKRTLMFSGQAKLKVREGVPYEIPILADRKLVRRAFDVMRANYHFDTITSNVQFTRHVGTKMTEQAGDLFRDESGRRLTMKDARAAYGAIVSAWLRPASYTEEVFMAKVLGHLDMGGLFTAESYKDFRLIGESRRDLRSQDRLSLRTQLKALELARSKETDERARKNLDIWISDVKRTMERQGFSSK